MRRPAPRPRRSVRSRALRLPFLMLVVLSAGWAQTETLPAPQLLSPEDGAEMHNVPREAWFEWSPVAHAETYTIEFDCEHCCVQGKFCSEVSPTRTFRASDLQGTKFRFDWWGDQRGRWRVWASAGFIEGEKSPWRMMSFRSGGGTAPPQAPKPLAPVSNAVLPASPAEVTFEWTPVAGAKSYTLEVDPQGGCVQFRYCSEVGVYGMVENITGTHYTGVFPMQMWTRWRVWAVAGDRSSLKSPWIMFQRPSAPVGLRAGAPVDGPAGTMPGSGSGATVARPPAAVATASPMTPEYSDAARAAGLEGTATVSFEVTDSGQTRNLKVLQGLGMGLDEKALQLVGGWRFGPNTPPVQAVEIPFRLGVPVGWHVRSAYYRVPRDARNEPEAAPPTLILYVKPEANSCPAGEHSIISISFEVDRKGLPDQVVVKATAAATVLRDAVRGWRFEPARVNGRERVAQGTVEMECGAGDSPGPAAAGAIVTPPSLLSKVEPEYSEEARRAKYNGSVSIQLVVDADGFPTTFRIARPVGLGLDEKAMAALKQWRFKPAVQDGKPIPYPATVEISFRLL